MYEKTVYVASGALPVPVEPIKKVNLCVKGQPNILGIGPDHSLDGLARR
jgi:hypothetical protein